MQYKNGNILASTDRNDGYELFVFVVEENDQTDDQFKAVVLLDNGSEYGKGFSANNWNKGHWKESNFDNMNEARIKK